MITIIALVLVGEAIVDCKGEDLSKDHLLKMVEMACPSTSLMCPKPEFGDAVNDGKRTMLTWNKEKIFEAAPSLITRNRPMPKAVVMAILREKFCCVHGSCLQNCNIWQRKEIDLIENFPGNVEEIFSLKLDYLEPYRAAVHKFLHKKRKTKKLPAVIEEYFDALAENQDEIEERLRMKYRY